MVRRSILEWFAWNLDDLGGTESPRYLEALCMVGGRTAPGRAAGTTLSRLLHR